MFVPRSFQVSLDYVQKGLIHLIFCLLLLSYNVVIKAHTSHVKFCIDYLDLTFFYVIKKQSYKEGFPEMFRKYSFIF